MSPLLELSNALGDHDLRDDDSRALPLALPQTRENGLLDPSPSDPLAALEVLLKDRGMIDLLERWASVPEGARRALVELLGISGNLVGAVDPRQ